MLKAGFRVLQLVAIASKGLGWLCLIAALILGGLIASGLRYFPLVPPGQPYSTNNLVGAVTTFLPLFIGFLFFYGVGGALQVLIAIERNTRPVTQQPPDDFRGEIQGPESGRSPETP